MKQAEYRPLVTTKILIIILAVISCFSIAFGAMESAAKDYTGIAKKPGDDMKVIDDPADSQDVPVDLSGILTFSEDSEVPSDANLALSTPYENGWSFTSQSEDSLSYTYTNDAYGCSVTSSIIEYQANGDSYTASSDLFVNYSGVRLGNEYAGTYEVVYNLNLHMQTIGMGFIENSGSYHWIFSRAFTTLDKGFIIDVECSSEDDLLKVADLARGQFGIIIE